MVESPDGKLGADPRPGIPDQRNYQWGQETTSGGGRFGSGVPPRV